MAIRLLLAVVVAMVLGGCGSNDAVPDADAGAGTGVGPGLAADANSGADQPATTTADATPPRPSGPTEAAPYPSTVASAAVPVVVVHDAPATGRPIHRLSHPTQVGAPLTFLVLDRRDGWLQVLLPVRPNGSRGWIRASDVTLTTHRYRITVSLSRLEITVTNGPDTVLREPVGIGTSDTPTPGGLYYLKELLQPPNPHGPYGPYAYGLSGFSNVLTSFAGGDGVIGIHGTDDPSTIGQRTSHGCIRMSNTGITRLARILPLGVPVSIEG